MKRILVFTAFLVITFSSLTKAQLTMHKMVHAGYVYQNQSFGEIGGRFGFFHLWANHQKIKSDEH